MENKRQTAESVKNDRLKRFQDLGIPMPEPTNNIATVVSKNPKMASIIESIKKGQANLPLEKFIDPIPAPSNHNYNIPKNNRRTSGNNQTKEPAVSLQEFKAPPLKDAEMMDKMLFGNSSASNTNVSYEERELPNTDIRQKLAERMNENRNVSTQQQTMLNLTEQELNDKISTICQEVAENICTDLFNSLLKEIKDGNIKSQPTQIQENNNKIKAKIIDGKKVKIGDKIFKLVPVDQ